MDLSILQAQWQVGAVAPEDVPAKALALLDDATAYPAVLELAMMHGASVWEIRPVVERAFAEAGLPPVTNEQAHWRLAYATAREIVAGETASREGAEVLWRICNELDYPMPLRYFVYLAADYGEGPEGPVTEAAWFDARIVEAARELLAREGRDVLARPSEPPV
ncbi:MAG TPA: hypothetical protein VNA89_13120 [Gemmatimonadaceae bacterium]|nr:hypothetical protein [Gemmatimonadaceae bacterium]